MGKDKILEEKEMQEKLNRLNRNIDECERIRRKMEEVIARYEAATNEAELRKQTYDSLIATHNYLIDQLTNETNE